MIKSIILGSGLFLAFALPALAYEPVFNTLEIPYEVLPIEDDPSIQRHFLGKLEGYPDTYEIKSDNNFNLQVEIRIPDTSSSTKNISGIIVRQTKTGAVAEVARLKAEEATWESLREETTGIKYLKGSSYSGELEAGTYRLEVSTPDNFGTYDLVVGSEERGLGYFTTIENIRQTLAFIGEPKSAIFSSPLAYYPLGIILVLVLIALTWWLRRPRHA